MLYLQRAYNILPCGRDKLKAIILAGGSGSRLWPLSNDETPKQLLAINSEYTLLQNTFRRLLKLTDAKNILTVTNHKFHEQTRCQLSQLASDSRILSEPCAKNTAPAICCALEYCLRSGGDDIAVIVPADHLIKEIDKFCRSIVEAAQAAEKGNIATVGIVPSYPETGFGYIKTSEKVAENIFKVEKFTEKPPLEIAKQYVDSGNYYWNGGIFIGKISVFLEEFARFAPEISALPGNALLPVMPLTVKFSGRCPKFPSITRSWKNRIGSSWPNCFQIGAISVPGRQYTIYPKKMKMATA